MTPTGPTPEDSENDDEVSPSLNRRGHPSRGREDARETRKRPLWLRPVQKYLLEVLTRDGRLRRTLWVAAGNEAIALSKVLGDLNDDEVARHSPSTPGSA